MKFTAAELAEGVAAAMSDRKLAKVIRSGAMLAAVGVGQARALRKAKEATAGRRHVLVGSVRSRQVLRCRNCERQGG